MPAELLAIDIGNSNSTYAQMRGLDVLRSFDLPSASTEDDILAALRIQQLREARPVAIASVNPRACEICEAALKRQGYREITVLGRDIKVPIENRADIPAQVGQDRLVNALAAKARTQGDAIVVDFGTAITFDVLMDSAYCGGVITPGIGLAMEALHQKTALLPLVKPQGKPPILGKNTIAAINAGVFYGYVGLAKNIIAELKKIYRNKPRVLATGGYGSYLAPHIEEIEEVVAHLTHEGIALSVGAAR
ncbi:type III pantothenate kinase [Planctomycetaceae bacterium]|nr:type III pantothenate kinase [Planctomycetaceae bacterium]